MDRLTTKIDATKEKDIQLKTRGVFRPITRQIGNSLADIKGFFEERSEDGVTVVPSECSPHLKHYKNILLHHIKAGSFLFQKNIVTGTEAAQPLLILMDSLALAMDLEVVARPSDVVCDVLLAVCNQPVIVLTLVDGNSNSDMLNEYNTSVAREVTGKLKTFMDDRVCVVSGVCCCEDIENPNTFYNTLKEHAQRSSFFIPLKTFETQMPKLNNIVTAIWASVAETNSVKNEDIKRFLTMEQCVVLLENINKKEVKVYHKPGSGATTLMLEVARRLSRLNETTLVWNEDEDGISVLHPSIKTLTELPTSDQRSSANIVVEEDTGKMTQIPKHQRCWKFVQLKEDEKDPNDCGEVEYSHTKRASHPEDREQFSSTPLPEAMELESSDQDSEKKVMLIDAESSMVVHTARNYQIKNQAIRDEGIPSTTLEKGSQASSHNWFKITIKNTKQQGQEIYERLINVEETLKSEDIHAMEIRLGSGIIKLSVYKSRIMTDEWIHEILQKISHDILKDFFTEKTVQVMCERHISMDMEHFLEIYSSHHSLKECFAKVKKLKDDDSYSISTVDSGVACLDDLDDLDYFKPGESITTNILQSNKGSTFSMIGYDIEGCKKCETILRKTGELPIPKTIYMVTHMSANIIKRSLKRETARTKNPMGGKNEKQQLGEARNLLRWKLKCLVSALRNSGGGVVLVHIDGLEQFDSFLGEFYELVDPLLDNLLEDGSLFVNTYRIKLMTCFLKEIGHTPNVLFSDVVYISANPSASVSTVNFNSKVGNDFELGNPTCEQIRRYLKTNQIFQSTVPHVQGLLNLQESRNVQCKQFWKGEQTNTDPRRLAEHIWEMLKLKFYLSAFSKVEGGGSFYVGVTERRETRSLSMYETTHYETEGFKYDSQQQDELKVALIRQIENETLVLFFDLEAPPAQLPPEYVEIVFHEVSADRVVLEVAIAAVNGLVFHTKEGPEAYELDEDDKLQRLNVQEWKKRLLME